jgi:hypothetical protein
MRRKEKGQTVSMKRLKISRTWLIQLFVPPLSLSVKAMIWATMAPSLPDAAEIPCAVDLYLVGKTSPG